MLPTEINYHQKFCTFDDFAITCIETVQRSPSFPISHRQYDWQVNQQWIINEHVKADNLQLHLSNVQNERQQRTVETETVQRKEIPERIGEKQLNFSTSCITLDAVVVLLNSVLVHAEVHVWKLMKDLDEVGVGQRQQFDMSASTYRFLVRRFRQHFSVGEQISLTHQLSLSYWAFLADYRLHHINLQYTVITCDR